MKSLPKAPFQMEPSVGRVMGIGVVLLILTGLVAAILVVKPDVKTFEKRVLPYVDCPDDEIQEFIEAAQGKQIVRCKQRISPGIELVLQAEYKKKREEATQRNAERSGSSSSRPARCDRAELASRVISDYYYYGHSRSIEELDAALNAIAYFLEQNGYSFEAQAIDNSNSLEEAISVYNNLIPQLCS